MEAKRKSRFDMSHLMQDMDLYNKALDEVIRIERGEYFRSYQINFKVHFESKYGDKIVVVGNLPQLGAWNPAQALVLQWAPGNYWQTSLELGEGEFPEVEYKYVCLRGVQDRWEAGYNRKLDKSQGTNSGDKIVFNLNDRWFNQNSKVF